MTALRPATAIASLLVCTLLVLFGCDARIVAPRAAERAKLRPTVTIRGLAGHGHVLAAATDRGVALWELPDGAVRFDGVDAGLPSADVRAVRLDARLETMGAATSAGLARADLSNGWAPAPLERPTVFTSCIARPGGGWIAGGADGLLVAWVQDRIDSLRLPRPEARIVALALAPALLEPVEDSARRLAPRDAITIAPCFVPGLVVATEGDGVWIMKTAGLASPRWLQLEACDGLRGTLRDIATDAAGRLWLASDAGVACLERGRVTLTSWPEEPWLAQPMRALLALPDSSVLAGGARGIVRIRSAITRDAQVPLFEIEHVGRVTALARADDTIWWTDGASVRSLDGRVLSTGGAIPPVICPIWHAFRRTAPAYGPGTAAVTLGAVARRAVLLQLACGFEPERSTRAAPGGGASLDGSS